MTGDTDLDAEMARYSWEAYRGLLGIACVAGHVARHGYAAAREVGLIRELDDVLVWDWTTTKGDRVLSRLHRVLDGMDSRVLDLLGGAPWDGPGRSDAEDTLVEIGALSCACGPCSHESCTLDITNVGRALLLLREHGKDGGN